MLLLLMLLAAAVAPGGPEVDAFSWVAPQLLQPQLLLLQFPLLLGLIHQTAVPAAAIAGTAATAASGPAAAAAVPTVRSASGSTAPIDANTTSPATELIAGASDELMPLCGGPKTPPWNRTC